MSVYLQYCTLRPLSLLAFLCVGIRNKRVVNFFYLWNADLFVQVGLPPSGNDWTWKDSLFVRARIPPSSSLSLSSLSSSLPPFLPSFPSLPSYFSHLPSLIPFLLPSSFTLSLLPSLPPSRAVVGGALSK